MREVARRLSVAPSTVSRQVGRLYVNHGSEKAPLLDWEQVQQAREAHLNTAMRRTAAPAAPVPVPEVGAPEVPPAPNTRGFWDTEYARERALDAKADRLQRFGALVERQAVDEAAFDLARMQREDLDAFAESVAPMVASMTEAREIAAYLRQQLRAMQNRWAGEAGRMMKATLPEGLNDGAAAQP